MKRDASDDLEADALDWTGAAIARLRTEKRAAVERAAASIGAIDRPKGDVGPIIESALRDVQRVQDVWGPQIRRARRAASQARAELDAFRQKSRLWRPPAPRARPARTFALFALVLAGSTAGAAALFAPAGAAFSHGAAIAFVFCATSLALGAAAGWFGLRRLEMEARTARLLGGVIVALGLAAETGLVVACLPGLDGPRIVSALLAACGAWTFAALQGRAGFDDPHPHYGKAARRVERAEADLARLSASARSEIDAAAARARAALDLQRSSVEDALAARRWAFDAAAAIVASCDARMRTLSTTPEPDDLAALGALIAEDETFGARRRRRRVNAAATIAGALEEASKRLDT